MIRRLLRLLAGIAALTPILFAAAAEDISLDSGLPLFSDRTTMAITIEGPVSTLISERSNEAYYDGLLRYTDSGGAERELDLKFRTRGNYRRRTSTCRFPPVRLNLKKKQVEGTIFEGQNILKLVTHCRPRSDRYEEYVLKEELAYRILNLHTPVSFRSRLMRITWIDTDDDNEVDERYGFVIEHKNELEERTGMEEAGIQRANYENLHTRQAAISAIFEYLIGNTDFSMVAGPANEDCCHNGILLRAESGELHYVPYDFDMAGIVNAPYAEPNPRFNLRRVTSRLYRGHCRFNPDLPATRAQYLDNQDAVLRLVDDQEGLSDRQRKRLRRFVEKFYEDLSDDRKFEGEILDECLGS